MNYLPDSIYTLCGENTRDCSVCTNNVYSNVVNAIVSDPLIGKVFCPFGTGQSMNQSIFNDQLNLNTSMPEGYGRTTWGHVPQLDPRPLAKIGLSWRTS
jgi:hypothetical protein